MVRDVLISPQFPLELDTAVVAQRVDLDHVDPRPPEDSIVRGLHIGHVELYDDVVQVRPHWEWDRAGEQVSLPSSLYR